MKNLNLLTLLALSLITSSCSRYYYKPTGVNVPLLTQQGDVHLDVNGSFSSESYSNGNSYSTNIIGVEASGSPINYLGLIANYYSYNFSTAIPDPASGNVNARATLADFGVGGYYAAGGGKIKMVVDIYGGWGFGNIQSDINADVTRMFIQPGIGMRSPWFDVAFTPRIVNVGYHNFSSNGRSNSYLQQQGLMDVNGYRFDQNRYTFFEPTITMRAGYKFAKMQLQYVMAAPMTAKTWNSSPGRFSIGFYFSLEDVISIARQSNAAHAD